MSSIENFPGYLGCTSQGVIAIHANWPAYPEEHGWQPPLLWMSIFPLRTKFVITDDIDRCVLLLADLKCNKPDKFDEKNFHLAVWHEDLIEMQEKGYIRGVGRVSHWQYEREFRKKFLADIKKRFGSTKQFYKGLDGKMVEFVQPPIGDLDTEWRDWPVFRNDSISLTAKGQKAAGELLLNTPRAELKPLGRRVLTAMKAGLYDTAVREAWTFYKLQSARAAELDNQTKLNALLRQQPVLAIEIKVTETAWEAESAKGLLIVLVSMKNEGDQNLDVFFDDAVLTVGRIAFDKAGHQSIKEQHRYAHGHVVADSNKLEPIPMRVFRAGQKRQLAFSMPITEPGGYFIEFQTIYQRRPFEGEKVSKKSPKLKPTPIDAVEQTIFFATGKRKANEKSE